VLLCEALFGSEDGSDVGVASVGIVEEAASVTSGDVFLIVVDDGSTVVKACTLPPLDINVDVVPMMEIDVPVV